MSKPKQSKREIFFHVGTGKTGTTFLQYHIFPYLKGIHYIQRTKHKNFVNLIKEGKHQRYLISREYDRQMEYEVTKYTKELPDTTPIIVFRRHDSYIASQYRRFVKNGFTGSLHDFFNTDQDSGFFKIHDLNYRRQIELLENRFDKKPLVYIYEELRKEPHKFIAQMAEDMNAVADTSNLNLNRKHTSYSEKQLKGVLALGKYLDLTKDRKFKSKFLNFLRDMYLGLTRYSTLYISALLPESFFTKEPLMNKEELNQVKDYFKEDWEFCLNYSKSNKAEATSI